VRRAGLRGRLGAEDLPAGRTLLASRVLFDALENFRVGFLLPGR
jgi:hypothetical protein